MIQRRSGRAPLHRHATASTSRGNGGRPRRRQVWRTDRTRSPQRFPVSLPVPWLRFRPKTPQRWARAAILCVASTPWMSRNTPSASPSRCQRRAKVPAWPSRGACWLSRCVQRAYQARHCPTVGRSVAMWHSRCNAARICCPKTARSVSKYSESPWAVPAHGNAYYQQRSSIYATAYPSGPSLG